MKPVTQQSTICNPAERNRVWQSSNAALARLLAFHRASLGAAVDTARRIGLILDTLRCRMDALCRRTCRFCPDPCCILNTVWFDFKDLLLFHLSGTPIPPFQAATALDEPCPFLGCHGCRLEFWVRPWMCMHYICPAQRAVIRKQEPSSQRDLRENLDTVADLRDQMESEVIRHIKRSRSTLMETLDRCRSGP
jgi:hypothetical protein